LVSEILILFKVLITISFPHYISQEAKFEIEKVLSLTEQLCGVSKVYFRYLTGDDIILLTNDKSATDQFDELHEKVMGQGQQNGINNSKGKLKSFLSFPIRDVNGTINGSLGIADEKAVSLNNFQSETIKIYIAKLGRLLSSSPLIGSSPSLLLNECAPYYFILNTKFEVLEIGVNFRKSTPQIKVGDSIFKYFMVDRKECLEDLNIGDAWFHKMHFLDIIGGNQRFKFTMRQIGDHNYLWASPIINSKFALKNYKVTVKDFPLHDTIAEFLFLEQTSRKSLEESQAITQNILLKNKEIIRIQKENEAISKFPEENPNPILRLDLNMNLIYSNDNSKKSFLDDIGIVKDQLKNEKIQKILSDVISIRKPLHHVFFEAKSRYYSVNIALIFEMGYLNIYAHDITEFRDRNTNNERALNELNNQLESQREFYEFILNNLPADVAVFDINHNYMFINPQGIKDEKTRSFMIGKNDYDYCRLKGISTKMADERRNLFNRVLKSKKREIWVDDLIDKNGDRNVIHRTIGPLFDENGDIRLVIGYGTEITQRVLAEEENVKLSLVAKNTNNGVLMLNTDMEITWANQAMIERSGYTLSEMRGKNPREFISKEKNSAAHKKLKEAIEKKQNVELEMQHTDKGGLNYYVSLNLQPLFDADNFHTGFMMVEFDITERLKNQETIQNLNVNLERLVQEKTAKNMELASSLRDQEKMVTIGELASGVAHDLNTPLGAIKSGTENVSYTLDVLFKNIIPKCAPDEIEYAFNRVNNSSFELFTGGVQMRREQQELLTYLKNQKVDFSDEKINNIASLMVKARMLIDNKKELQFILNSADPILFLDLIYHVRLVFSFVQTISTSGDRASEVIQNLRLFIREKRNIKSGVVNIKNNIRTVLNIFSHKIENIVDLTFEVDPSINVKGYDVRLFQLWSNLIKNALESMEDQKGLKTLKLYSKTTRDNYWITVENNGPPISEENQLKIFNKFFTTKGKKKGSGLGLNIVKNVLEEHQGKISLESDKDITKFIITFKRDK
jgi:PAS domain S-box-containing protein